MESTARRAIVHGTVQGVGFRYYTASKADEYGVRGWVRNEYDGTVRVHAEGSPSAVAKLMEWLKTGPTWAHVTSVDYHDVRAEGFRSFEVR